MTRSVPLDKLLDDADRLGPEWRSAAARAGLSDAAVAARLGRQHQHQMAASPRVRRPGVHDPRGNLQVHRSDARWHRAAVHVRHGGEIDHHLADDGHWRPARARTAGEYAASPGPAGARSPASKSVPTAVRPGARRAWTIRCCPLRIPGSVSRGPGTAPKRSSRAARYDETGYVQPSRAALVNARGLRSIYHYNGIQSWKIAAGTGR